jgi:hypothetical protein
MLYALHLAAEDLMFWLAGIAEYIRIELNAWKQIGWERMTKEPTRTLSNRQPHAEAIIRGVKKTEYRSAATKIRGRIYIYASLGRYDEDDEAEMIAQYGIDDANCYDLTRGVIIGSVDLYDCDEGDWHVKEPVRAKTLRKPTSHLHASPKPRRTCKSN